MGNIFAGHEDDVLPMMQCHEFGATSGTGRSCDPSLGSYNCVSDCSATCAQSSGAFTSCDITVNGTVRTYTDIITTYLPTDSTQGCLGWGYNYSATDADYTESGDSSRCSWDWDWDAPPTNSCSWHCGGYTASGCSCTPGCAAAGNCCADYSTVCGIPPAWSGPTSGVSTCPSGYTRYTGSLSSTTTVQYWPSSSGYTQSTVGTHHGTLLGPSGYNYDLQLEKRSSSGSWSVRGQSERSSASESIHWFYATSGSTFRWKVSRRSGSGSYTLCVKTPT